MRLSLGVRTLILITVVFGASLLARTPGTFGTPAAHAAGTTTVTVHYYRPKGDYGDLSDIDKSWNVWLWGAQPAAAVTDAPGAGYTFQGTDTFGAFGTFTVPAAATQVGIIIRFCQWNESCNQKDVAQDRFVNTSSGSVEVWLLQGVTTIYTDAASANKAKAELGQPYPAAAFLDGTNWLAVKLGASVDLSTAKTSDFTVTDLDSNATIPVTGISDLLSGGTSGSSGLVKLTLAAEPDITHRLQLTDQSFDPVAIENRLVINDPKYYYPGTLGSVWSKKSTTFRVWAPFASKVKLLLYKNESKQGKKTISMARSQNGTWLVKVKGNEKNKYYLYQVTNFGKTASAVDPYARGVGIDGNLGMVVDLKATNPTGWSSDTYRNTGAATNASIYEVHVRDFSIDGNSGMKNRGKYLAFTEHGTTGPGGVSTGVDSLKQLGITHVELQPIFGCATLDDITGGSTDPAPAGDGSRYNWCYDPKNYNVPNGAYATNPHGTARIKQVKQMVQSLHKDGFGVIMDVVYNHTFSASVFDPLVPNYYYRQDYSGNIVSYSGAGPDVAAERPMVHKFIVDSVLYWAKQYHVDGFRFDLMDLLGKNVMQDISTQLHQLNPSAVILGEPWNILPSSWTTSLGANISDVQMTQGVQKGMHVGMFNDGIRDNVAGNVSNLSSNGYVDGNATAIAAFNLRLQNAGEVQYSSTLKGWAQNPDEDINYASSHDNYTLWDHIDLGSVTKSEPQATKIAQDELAQAIVFTSQGVPFMQGGEEFLRTKQGNGNSYISGDAINQFDWSLKSQNQAVFDYYAGLIHLRNAHPAFRMSDPAMISQDLQFFKTSSGVQEFELTGNANGDSWKNITVIYNPTSTVQAVTLPGDATASWNIVAQAGTVGTTTLGTASGSVSVAPESMEMLYQ